MRRLIHFVPELFPLLFRVERRGDLLGPVERHDEQNGENKRGGGGNEDRGHTYFLSRSCLAVKTFLTLLALAAPAHAATYTAASPSATHVQAAMDLATATGDIVEIPAGS